MTSPHPPAHLSFKNIVVSALFILFWILPVLYTGLTKQPVRFLHPYFSYQSNVSCLFEREQLRWSNYYVQIQSAPAAGNGGRIDMPQYSRMKPFGTFTRLEYYLMYPYRLSHNGTDLEAGQIELAEFVRGRYETLYPDDRVRAIRLVRVDYPVDEGYAFGPRRVEAARIEYHRAVPARDTKNHCLRLYR